MKTWLEPGKTPVPDDLRHAIGGHPLIARILAQRGHTDPAAARAFLDPDHYTPASSQELPDLERALQRLQQAIGRAERICVWGDFDVDGQTSTTLLVATLRDLGADPAFHIPVRASESHGVNLPVLSEIIERGVDLLLTCDTGIDAHEAVDYARSRGVDVIITDHHDLTPELPAALVVNPKRLPGDHPLATLPGVGVAYKLAEALYAAAGRPADCRQHLDLVALGIVADVAEQQGDTRYLLQRGLAELRRTQRLGLQAMLARANIQPQQVSEEHIGFTLGPQLNALGRLDDANKIVDFLTTGSPGRAAIFAVQLEGLNGRRKALTEQVETQAESQLKQNPALLDHAALVLADPRWPAGVIGIVASRLVERYNRPVVLIAAPEGQPGRGSARSVDRCHITQAIAEQKALLHSFGGHPMAAGLAIDPQNIPAFRLGLSASVRRMLGDAAPAAALAIDAYTALDDLSLDFVAELERLAPFGAGNPKPILATRDLAIRSQRIIGRDRSHLSLVVEDQEGAIHKVLWWRGAGEVQPSSPFDLAYTLGVNTFRGQSSVQLTWQDARPCAVEKTPELPIEPPKPALELIDLRRKIVSPLQLEDLPGWPDVQVWAEGRGVSDVEGRPRGDLSPARTLVVWTSPPGRRELQAAIATVSPGRVILVGADPAADAPKTFLPRLAGLLKFALSHHDGQVSIAALAGATAQSEISVRLGIAWLVADGKLKILGKAGDHMLLQTGGQLNSAEKERIARQLAAALAETKAYRRHFQRADPDALI